MIKISSLPHEWKTLIKILEKEIRKSQSVKDIQNYFKVADNSFL